VVAAAYVAHSTITGSVCVTHHSEFKMTKIYENFAFSCSMCYIFPQSKHCRSAGFNKSTYEEELSEKRVKVNGRQRRKIEPSEKK
jgi:hypothetical protein